MSYFTFRGPGDAQSNARFHGTADVLLGNGGAEPTLPISPGLNAYGQAIAAREASLRQTPEAYWQQMPRFNPVAVAAVTPDNPPDDPIYRKVAQRPSTTRSLHPAYLQRLGTPSIGQQRLPLRFPKTVRGRHLLDQYGDEWVGIGDSAWDLGVQLRESDIGMYLADRAAKGVNTIIVQYLEHLYTDHAPNNVDNVAPFSGANFSTSLNTTYAQRFDNLIQMADQFGIFVWLVPLYGGFDSDDTQGWRVEAEAATNANMTTYGSNLATRFGAYRNVGWMLGHDRTWNSFLTFKQRVHFLSDAIAAGSTQLQMLGGGVRGTRGGSVWSGTDLPTAGNVDSAYTDNATPGASVATMYAAASLPIGLIEGYYEQEHSLTPGILDLRNQIYGPMASGSVYNFWGNNPIWSFGNTAGGAGAGGGTWQTALNLAGSKHLGIAARFFASLGVDYAQMLPDTGNVFFTTGVGTGATQGFASYSQRVGIVWQPKATDVVINLAVFTGHVRVRWFDPTNETYTVVSASSANTGTLTATHPGTNSNGNGDSDYVLVVDSLDAVVDNTYLGRVISRAVFPPRTHAAFYSQQHRGIEDIVDYLDTGTPTIPLPAPLPTITTRPRPTQYAVQQPRGIGDIADYLDFTAPASIPPALLASRPITAPSRAYWQQQPRAIGDIVDYTELDDIGDQTSNARLMARAMLRSPAQQYAHQMPASLDPGIYNTVAAPDNPPDSVFPRWYMPRQSFDHRHMAFDHQFVREGGDRPPAPLLTLTFVDDNGLRKIARHTFPRPRHPGPWVQQPRRIVQLTTPIRGGTATGTVAWRDNASVTVAARDGATATLVWRDNASGTVTGGP